MDKERAFKDLLALCVKRWKTLIIGMIIGALVMGYVQYNVQMELKNDPENSEEAIEERYQKAMSDYYAQIDEIDGKIFADERTIANNQEYIDNSLAMRIDPYNECVSIVDVSIDITDEVEFSKNYGYATTPVDFMVGKVKTQYLAAFNNLAIESLEGLSKIHEGVSSKYWDEVLRITSNDGFILELYGIAPTKEEAEAITNSLYEFLMSKKDIISSTAYPHELLVLSDVTKVIIDNDLLETQNDKKNAVYYAKLDIDTQLQYKDNLVIPEKEIGFDENEMMSAIKLFAAIGLVVGLIGAMVVIMFHAIAVTQVITSEEIIKNCKLAYMGTLSKSTYTKERWGRCFSDWLSGERLWKTKEESIDYIIASMNLEDSQRRVVLTSTQNINEADLGVQALKEALESKKVEVMVCFDALHNAKFIDAIKKTDDVVLLEKPVASRMNMIDAVKDTCERLGVKRVRFVMMTK